MKSSIRKYRRKKIRTTAKLEKMRDGQHMITSYADNLSQKGMGIQTYQPLTVGTVAVIEIEFIGNDMVTESVEVVGTVIWTRNVSGIYDSGIAFEEGIDPDTYPRIHRFLSS